MMHLKTACRLRIHYSADRCLLLAIALLSTALLNGCDRTPSSGPPVEAQQLLKKLEDGLFDNASCRLSSDRHGTHEWLDKEDQKKVIEILKHMLSSPGSKPGGMGKNHKCAGELNITFYAEASPNPSEESRILSIECYCFNHLVVDFTPGKELEIEPFGLRASPESYKEINTFDAMLGEKYGDAKEHEPRAIE